MKEPLIRTYYSGYEKKDRKLSGGVLADSFILTSPNDDDPISSVQEKCILNQLDFINHFELETILACRDEAFVKYLCWIAKSHIVSHCGAFSLRR